MNKDQPLVSIIIPSYNQGVYLKECLESVLSQTYSNIEVIIVDDGSTDAETLEFLSVLNDSNINVIHVENGGVCKARNIGISSSKGSYILPLDDDDQIAADYVSSCIHVFESNEKVDVVYGITKLFGEVDGLFVLPKYNKKKLLTRNMVICGAMYRKVDYNRVGGYNENMIYGLEDWDFWLSFAEINKVFYRINKIQYYYRVKPISRNKDMERKHDARYISMHNQLYENHKLLYSKNSIEFQDLLNAVTKNQTLIDKIKFHFNKLQLKIALKYNVYSNQRQ